MLQTQEVAFQCAEARHLYQDALEMLDKDRLRNAADKAWCAAERTTDALILARAGDEPRTSGDTMRMIRQLRRQDPSQEPLRVSYAHCPSFLHGAAFCHRILEPADDIIADVREAINYLRNAEVMAGEV